MPLIRMMAAKPLTAGEKTVLRAGLEAFYKEGDAENLKVVFGIFDRNLDGRISRGELSVVLRGLHAGVTDTRIDNMMSAADVNHDGCIDLREFIAVMEQHR